MTDIYDVIIASVGAAGVIATAYFGRTKVKERQQKQKEAEHERDQYKNEIAFKRASLSFEEFLTNWADISQDIDSLMLSTNVDRFLLLRAWNGLLEPKYTTAFYQIRQGNQKPVSYVHYELDDDYVQKLRHISKANRIYLEVDKMPDSGIKRIYDAENVKFSYWIHLKSEGIPGTESKSITYCSFATHSEHGIEIDARTRCDVISSRMKEFF